MTRISYGLTNKHTSTPEETICHFPVARVAWAVCSVESHRNWQNGMNHYCHLPYTRNTETRPPEMNSDWSASVNMEVCLQFCWFLSEEFTSHSQHRQADIAPMIPMSMPNIRAHKRGLVMACHACETTFWREMWLFYCWHISMWADEQWWSVSVCGFFTCK